MKKLIVAIALFALVIPAQASASTVKAGSKCSKAGITAVFNGKKFTCIKKSGKLVWNSGVVIKKNDALPSGICPAKLAADKVEITKTRANTLLTMTESDSVLCSEKLGWTWRIGQRDDEIFPLTMDYRPDRVTVTVKNGLVTAALVG